MLFIYPLFYKILIKNRFLQIGISSKVLEFLFGLATVCAIVREALNLLSSITFSIVVFLNIPLVSFSFRDLLLLRPFNFFFSSWTTKSIP